MPALRSSYVLANLLRSQLRREVLPCLWPSVEHQRGAATITRSTKYLHAYIRTHQHPCKIGHAHAHTYAHTHTHTHAHTHTHTHTHTRPRTCTRAHKHRRTHTHMYTYTYTYSTHADTNTDTYKYNTKNTCK